MRPTPELKSRFLDADKPDTTAMEWAKPWLVRLVVVYPNDPIR
jgi:hypothetical protein